MTLDDITLSLYVRRMVWQTHNEDVNDFIDTAYRRMKWGWDKYLHDYLLYNYCLASVNMSCGNGANCHECQMDRIKNFKEPQI